MPEANSMPAPRVCKQASLKIGDTFRRLMVIGPPVIEVHANRRRYYVYPCRCQCGKELPAEYNALVRGNTKSCGCLQRDKVRQLNRSHGLARTRLHRIWCNIKSRCHNPRFPRYGDYGGRGIRVCNQWRKSFQAFHVWAITSGYADGLTIERRDNDADYSPGNCMWIPHADQRENTRNSVRLTLNGETKSAGRWAKDPRCTVTADAIRHRVKVLGWDAEAAVLTPATRAHR